MNSIFWCTKCEEFIEIDKLSASDYSHNPHKEKVVGFGEEAFKHSIKRFIYELKITDRLIKIR